MPVRLCLIDNYDSYTYNLSHLLSVANSAPPTIILSDAYPTLSSLTSALGAFDAFILSPGPGSPTNGDDFPLLEREIVASNVPVWGVCLGHQAICAAFGATVKHASAGAKHGIVSTVRKVAAAECPLFADMPTSFRAVRYHSLAVEGRLGAQLVPTAWTEDVGVGGEVCKVLMAVRHKWKLLFGVQFHPESVGTEFGLRLARNFVRIVEGVRGPSRIERGLAGVERKMVAEERKGLYRTEVRQMKDVVAESVDLFVRLYGGCSEAFWLDSSSAVRLRSSVSRCSSPELSGGREADDEGRERESGDRRKGRYSIMGSCNGPLSEVVVYDVSDKCVRVRDSRGETRVVEGTTVFDYLDVKLKERYAPQHAELPIEMNGGYVGFFGYELKADADAVRGNRYESDLPDAWFVFADRVVVVDHEEGIVFLVGVVREGDMEGDLHCEQWFNQVSQAIELLTKCISGEVFKKRREFEVGGKFTETLQFIPERNRREYLCDIRECLREITDGESYEVCLTNRLRTVLPEGCKLDPLDIYCALRQVNPAPYAAFLRLDKDVAVCCSSPERYLRITSAGVVESKPIKGTVPRGRSLQEDEMLRNQLQKSPKDRSENLMIVDLVRNDLSRTCVVGSVQVPKLMDVESYATVHQLVSTVTGVLARVGDTVGCIRAAYPMGSMTGAPKVRTMEIIERLERSSRGIYSGSIGYLSVCGGADLNVVIRTAIVKGRAVEIGVGGAIVNLSCADEEYEEIILKGKALMQSLAVEVTGRNLFIVVDGEETGEDLQ